jgi:poly(A) polymerase
VLPKDYVIKQAVFTKFFLTFAKNPSCAWVRSNLLKMNFAEFIQQHPVLPVIVKAAKEKNLKTYAIGGFVRDLLLQRPCKDIDVVCLGSGIALAEYVAKLVGKDGEVTIFKNFGTAMLKVGEWEVEFVGARKESYRQESRKPIVENGTLEDDQNRRDFTINAFAISLNVNDLGELLDPFGGLQHLKKKTIKTPLDPDITFSDDPLRMMRAIRFATQLNFDIDPDTFDAIIRNKERLLIVSQERITDELNKIILAKTPSYGFKMLFTSGLLKLFFPEMCDLYGVDTIDGKAHKDNFYHTLKVLDNLTAYSNDLWLRWAAILHDIAKPATKRFDARAGWTFHGHEDRGEKMVAPIFRRLKLPMNEKMKFVEKMVKLHLRPIALIKETVTESALRRLLFDTGDDIDALMKLVRADITSKDGIKVKKYLENYNKVEKRLKEVEERDHIRNFQPIITGELIMETFGLQPTKEVGIIKIQVREAILDGHIRNEFPEAYYYMLEKGSKLGLSVVKPMQF